MGRIAAFLLRMLPAMAAALPFALVFRLWAVRRLRRQGLATTPLHEAGLLAFLLFLAGLAAVTILPRGWQWTAPTWDRVNLRLFRVFRDSLAVWRSGDSGYFVINVLGNLVMFFPLGFFPALLWEEKGHGLLRGTGTALFASCVIEFCQLFQNRGTDVDDLWLNALGGAVGYGIYRLLERRRPGFAAGFRLRKKERTAARALS